MDHLVQPPWPKQGHLQQVAQDHVQAGLEYLQRRRMHNVLGQPVPVLRHPESEEPQISVERNNERINDNTGTAVLDEEF